MIALFQVTQPLARAGGRRPDAAGHRRRRRACSSCSMSPIEPAGRHASAARARGEVEVPPRRLRIRGREGRGAARHFARGAAGRHRRDRRALRQRQVDAGDPAAALLRPELGRGADRRRRRARVSAVRACASRSPRQPGSGAVRRHHPQQHRLRRRRASRRRNSSAPRGPPTCSSSSSSCRRASTRWSAIAACCSRAGSASASRSRARCCAIRRS